MSAAHSPHAPQGRRRTAHFGRAVRWSMVLAWSAVIFAASSLPASKVPGRFGTLAHFVEYAVLGGLLYAALLLDSRPGRSAVLAVLIASAYGATDELHQMLTPGRVPDVMDWVVDTLGALAGTAAALAISRFRSRQPRADRSPTDAP